MMTSMVSTKRGSTAADAFLRQLDQQENCDVVFQVEEEKMCAHKSFLTARSDVFDEMLNAWSPEKEPIVVHGMTVQIFKIVLRYVYSDEVEVTNDNVFELLYAAHQLEMDHLEAHCTKHLKSVLSKENVCFFMNEGVNFGAVNLKSACGEIFSKETKYVLDSEPFLQLSQPGLSGLLDVEETNVLEMDLFLGVKKWMAEQCRRGGLPETGANMKKCLDDALFKIHFPAMSVHDFSNHVSTIEEFLDSNDVAQIFRKITVSSNDNIECAFSNRVRCVTVTRGPHVSGMSQFPGFKTIYNANNNSWNTLSYHTALWSVSGYNLHRKSFQILLQCYADLTNSSEVGSHVEPKVDSTVKSDVCGKVEAWQTALGQPNVQVAMEKFLELRKQLAELQPLPLQGGK